MDQIMKDIEETIVEMEAEKEDEELEISLIGTGVVAALGAIKPLAGGTVYTIGLGVGLLFGKKAAFKTMGTYLAVNALMNTADYLTGGYSNKD